MVVWASPSFFNAAPKPSESYVHEGRQINIVLGFADMFSDPKDIKTPSLLGGYQPGDSRYLSASL